MSLDTHCALCSRRGTACEFHAAGDVPGLVKAVLRALKKKGGIALARFITSAIAGLEAGIPDGILDELTDLDVRELETHVQERMAIAAQKEMTPNELRELAGCFIALAILADEDDGDDDAEDED
jgi:hypothetical protein